MAESKRDQNRVTTLLGVSDADQSTPVDIWADASTHELLVKASVSITPSGTQDVNLTKVGGVAVALGNTTMSASIPVTIASNQTALPVTLTSTTITGTVAVTQSTSPWIVAGGGTAGSAATGVVTVQGIASMTPVQVSQATASNLNATVSQATGTNLHTVIDSGTVTVTATNLSTNIAQIGGNAVVQGSGTATNALRVELANNGTGVLATVGAVTSITNSVTTTAVGTIADDSPTPGAPVMVGGTAKSPDGTDPSSVSAENDVTRNITDLNRRLYTNTWHPRTLSFHSDGSSALTDTSVAADPGDGFQVVLLSIIFSTGSATACNIFFEEGSTKILGPWYLEAVAGRGVFWEGYKPVTASTAVTVTTSAAIAQSLDVTYMIQAV